MGEALDDDGSVGTGYADAAVWWLGSVASRLREWVNEDGKTTYKPLRRKMPTNWILRFRSMCRFQINGNGSNTVMTSETTLMDPGMHAAKRMLTQEPSTSRSHALFTGVHWKTERKASAMLLARITKAKIQRMVVKRGMTPKMRWKRRRAEYLKAAVPTQ